jgi:hypothetical protein
MGARPFAVGSCIVYTHEDRVRDFSGSWRPLVVADVRDDDGTVADFELRAVALPDLKAFLEAERGAEPAHRLPNVGIDQDGNDRGRGDRAVRLHRSNVIDRPKGEVVVDSLVIASQGQIRVLVGALARGDLISWEFSTKESRS